jgi:hypothetical protein
MVSGWEEVSVSTSESGDGSAAAADAVAQEAGSTPPVDDCRAPAWRRSTTGESPWSAVTAALLAVVLQVVLPRGSHPGTGWSRSWNWP